MTSLTPSMISLRVLVPIVAALLIAVAIPAWPAWGGEVQSDTLVLAGCGSNVPALRLLAQAYREQHPNIVVQLQAVGSTSGISMAAVGAVPVALASRELRDGELGLGLTIIPYARTPVVLAAHPTVADNDVSTRELLALYQGAHRQWRTGENVVLLTREEGDSAVQVFRRVLSEFGPAYLQGVRRGWGRVVYSEQQMHRALTNTPFALGLSDLGMLTVERPPLKFLTIDGLPPTLENLASGRYPFAKTLAFVFRPGRPSAEAMRFLGFVQSREGQKILAANGYLPVGPAE